MSEETNIIEEFTLSQRPGAEGDFNSGLALRTPFNTAKYTNYGGVSLSLDNKSDLVNSHRYKIAHHCVFLNPPGLWISCQ